MNYIDYFKKGGNTAESKKLAEKIFAATNALQIPEEVVNTRLSELVQANDTESMEALQLAVDSFIQSNGQDEQSAQTIIGIFQPESQSAMFKCGGKLQQLTDKFANGGKSRCGCSGIKVAKEGVDTEEGPKVKYKKHKDGSETLRMKSNRKGYWTETEAKIEKGDTTLTQKVATSYGYRLNKINKDDIRYEQIMKDLRKGLPKKQSGGIVFAQDGGYAKAVNYYRNHANEGIIRKIQNFLAGRGYDVGDLDGKFGKRTFAAIQKYQQDNGLAADGMWGEDTNQLHRVLSYDNSTFSGKRSGANPGKHTFKDNYAGFRYSSGNNGKAVSMSDIGNAQALAISNYDWFTGNDENAVKWRSFFRDSKDPRIQAMYNEILDSYTPGQRRAISYKQLPVDRQQENYNAGIAEAKNNAAPYVAAALAAPVAAGEMIATPLVFGSSVAGGLAGGYLGGKAGRRIGDDISHPVYDDQSNLIGWSNINSELAVDRNGRQIPVAVPSYGQTGEDIGKVVGSTVGAVAGGMAPEYISFSTDYNPTGVVMKRPGVLRNPKTGKPIQGRAANGTYSNNKQGSWYMDIYNGQRLPGYKVGALKNGGIVKNLN